MISGNVLTGREWVTFPPEEYLDAIDTMVHQSFKSVNTNCAAGGVLIGNDQGVALPYVAVRTLLAAGQPVLLDRTTSVRSSIISSQIQRIDQGRTHGASLEEVDLIQKALARARARGKVLCKELSPRLRQILLPREDGSYLSVSPISVAGLSERLRVLMTQKAKVIAEMREQNNPLLESTRLIETCQINIGGANFQNAVGLAAIRTAICIEPPTASMTLDDLLYLHNHGVTFHIPKPLEREYTLCRNAQNGAVDLSPESEAKRQQLVKRITKHFLRLGVDALELLEQNQHRLPERRLLNPALTLTRRALIDPSLRAANWPIDFARLITTIITQIDSNRKTAAPYSSMEIRVLSSIVQGLLE